MNKTHLNRREALGLLGASAFGATAQPNIVYILADDLGYGDVHFLNPERGRIATPNIDRLASEGVSFTDAHSGSAVCSPTRYGVLTGRYAWRSRLQRGVLGPYDTPLIARDRLTVPQMLRERGYATACIGKWHLGWDWPKEQGQPVFDRPIPGGPTDLGFDTYFGTDIPNYPPFCFIENQRTVGIPSVMKPKETYGTPGLMLPGWKLEGILPAITQRATGFIRDSAQRQKPFFLYFPLISPHTPLAVADEWKGKSGLGLYGDWVMQTDWSVGEVLKALDSSGVAGNTLVVFTSDNGYAPYIGVDDQMGRDQQGRVREMEAKGHFPSAHLRGYKSDIWEGGHRVPFVARWPGVTKGGTTNDQLICLTDLMATCAEILGTKIPETAGEDSVSWLPALRGGSGRRTTRDAVVHHSIDGRFAIRQGRWKLVLCPGSGGWTEPTDAHAVQQGMPAIQLYDLARDPSERNNLQGTEPNQVRRLTGLLDRYIADGRSTRGSPQKNDVAVDVWKKVESKKTGSD
jgi:arylsulfatase A-like enzyme